MAIGSRSPSGFMGLGGAGNEVAGAAVHGDAGPDSSQPPSSANPSAHTHASRSIPSSLALLLEAGALERRVVGEQRRGSVIAGCSGTLRLGRELVDDRGIGIRRGISRVQRSAARLLFAVPAAAGKVR